VQRTTPRNTNRGYNNNGNGNYSNNSNYDNQSSYNKSGNNNSNNTSYTDNQNGYNNGYDYYYTSRLRRFNRPYYGFGFFDPVYVDSYYYDPYLSSGLSVLIYDNPYYSSWNRFNRFNSFNYYSGYNNYGGFGNYGFGGGFGRGFGSGLGWGGGFNNFGWGGFNNYGWGSGFNNYGWGGGFNNYNGFNNWGYCSPSWGNGFAYNSFNNVYNNNYYNNNGNGNGTNGGVARDNNSYYGPRRGGAAAGPDPALTPRPAPGFTNPGGRAEVQRASDRIQNTDRQALTPNNGNLRNDNDGSAPGVIQPGGRNITPQRQTAPSTDPRSIGNDGNVVNPSDNYNGGGRRLPAPVDNYDRTRQNPGNTGLGDGNRYAQPIDRSQPYNYDRTRQSNPAPVDNGNGNPGGGRNYTQDRTPNNQGNNNGGDFFNDRPRTYTQDRSAGGVDRNNNNNNSSGGGGFFNDRPRSYAPDRTPSYNRSSGYGSNDGFNNNNNGGGGFNNTPRSSGGGGFNSGGSGGRASAPSPAPAPSSSGGNAGGRRNN
jgi:hypothetical protein